MKFCLSDRMFYSLNWWLERVFNHIIHPNRQCIRGVFASVYSGISLKDKKLVIDLVQVFIRKYCSDVRYTITYKIISSHDDWSLPFNWELSVNTAGAFRIDGGQSDDREHSKEVVFLLCLAPGTLGLSQLIGPLASEARLTELNSLRLQQQVEL